MIAPLSVLLLAVATLTSASPAVVRRAVQKLDQTAFAEAQQRDGTAKRAFSSIAIKVCGSAGCLCHTLINFSSRPLMGSASQLINCPETSAQTSPPFKLPRAMALRAKNGM